MLLWAFALPSICLGGYACTSQPRFALDAFLPASSVSFSLEWVIVFEEYTLYGSVGTGSMTI